MKVVILVQARTQSKRFPNKVLKEINGTPIILILMKRLQKVKLADNIVLATTNKTEDDVLANFIKEQGFDVFRGNEEDVLDRFYHAAQAFNANVVVRITGDCPLVDAKLIDSLISKFISSDVDYLSNTNPPTYPNGLDIEVFSFKALKDTYEQAITSYDKEHVTPFLYNSSKFKNASIKHDKDYSHIRITVDEPVDLETINNIYLHFSPNEDFYLNDIIELFEKQPELFQTNQHLIRNEGSRLCNGQKLWKRAKRFIPGGNMMLSKRPEMFLPSIWPTYYSKAQGCKVWDLDDKEYTDVSMMGIGTNTLGYSHPEVDEAVKQTICNGNMSTLNCPEEVYLAERLVNLHPWAQMVRFARTGGEANAIAVRIARAASGKDKVAFCGYHGWHDWYLAANINSSETLQNYLLPGLEPNGTPKNLRDTVFPFTYNKLHELEAIISAHDIGVIKMEVSRNQSPEPGFLENIRRIATEKGIVLIFDECTSGFRETFGGLHKKYGVEPDMAIFGKALGNGYAITATIGKKEVMEAAQTSFISSTFWTERIGPTAGLKTLEVMERIQSWDKITAIGNNIRENWSKLANKYGLQLTLTGIPALSGFSINSPNSIAYKTLITQELLKKNFLASNSIYASIAHTPEVLENYFEALDPVFALIAECENGRDIMELLESQICHVGFQRLN